MPRPGQGRGSGGSVHPTQIHPEERRLQESPVSALHHRHGHRQRPSGLPGRHGDGDFRESGAGHVVVGLVGYVGIGGGR